MRLFLLILAIVSLAVGAQAKGGAVSEPKLFPVVKMDGAEAAKRGYRRVSVDLGAPALNFSALVTESARVNRIASAKDVPTPGREKVVTIYAPQDRNVFAVTIEAFAPGFAAEAAAASEQLLFEGGYELADTRHRSLVSGESFGLIRENGEPARAARSLCSVRGDHVLCALMEFDAEHEAVAMEQAAVFVGSLVFDDKAPDAFEAEAVALTTLPLGDGESLALKRPSAWTVEENSFQGKLPGIFSMVHGDKANPFSSFVFTASPGSSPAASDLPAVAEKLIGKYVADNAHLFANPKLAVTENVRGLDPERATSGSFVFVADKVAGGGQAQLRLALVASGGRRYSMMLATHYSPEVDESGPFFARWAGVTAYDLAMESLVAKVGG